MITLNDLKNKSAISLLETYKGINPYLIQLKNQLNNKNFSLTENQIVYIVNNVNNEPLYINRLLTITSYLGEELQKKNNLSFTPTKILVEFILAETDKTFHVYGKIKKNQKQSELYWLPKTQLIDDPFFEEKDINIDFGKYDEILKKYNKKLYDHQKFGIKYLVSRDGCILADDMGLGKTMEAIVAAIELNVNKILVITTASAKINWEREINIFDSNTTIINSGVWSEAKFTIINYDILKNFHVKDDNNILIKKDIVDAKFDLIIIDEAHYLKEKDSIRGSIMLDVCTKFGDPKVWLLTGTPVVSRPMDLYNLLKLIKSPLVKNWNHYVKRYCDGKNFYKTLKNGKKKKIWLTNGASNLEELANKTKNIILRRLKIDVLDMPDKIITPLYYELSNDELETYNLLWEDYLNKRISLGKKNHMLNKDLVELILLRQYIARITIPHTIKLADECLDLNKKIIIFTNFNEEIEILQKHFGEICVTHNGSMSINEKQNSVDQFQNNPDIKVFIGNQKSAGVAITLTEASSVIFNSFSWVTGDNEQCEDRAFRIGQKNNVNVFYLLFLNTISMRMWETLKNKKYVIDKILGENNINNETELIIDNILNNTL